ncbi:hypothetical protein ROZALSC1DRAFT_26685 [Rozella allomycis CSF55]|uniref:Uncharacterized protein n=1 Tax=Rozella allomycis (strain CSF55) TaxID=988480 RepID=A0A075B1D4_ROZAC|nr:hypothetical protein O9G_002908 [Rozella allomycis CSF55]RKP21925.1 hypothetical protein ROZALSC1DRAFT_26685 [Rozella allomycis CSF55]|eukprot:EPZ36406.1 hypothetical protein O9G_002908 [Rozella allomycis CSF55]
MKVGHARVVWFKISFQDRTAVILCDSNIKYSELAEKVKKEFKILESDLELKYITFIGECQEIQNQRGLDGAIKQYLQHSLPFLYLYCKKLYNNTRLADLNNLTSAGTPGSAKRSHYMGRRSFPAFVPSLDTINEHQNDEDSQFEINDKIVGTPRVHLPLINQATIKHASFLAQSKFSKKKATGYLGRYQLKLEYLSHVNKHQALHKNNFKYVT